MKGEFAHFVKEHYEKVRHLPARERLKKLGEMYRGGAPAKPKREAKKTKGGSLFSELRQMARGGGLLSDAMENLGPVGELLPMALGAGLEKPKKARGGKRVAHGGKVVEMPMHLVPPSVPVDRVSTKGTNVPGPLRSGVKTYTPHSEAVMKQRMAEPNPMVQAEGSFIRQGASKQPTKESTDLKSMLKLFGMTMPKHMRNVPHGGKLTKKHLARIYHHIADKHGEERAGNLFSDMWRGFSTGFQMPFKAIGKVASAVI